MVGAAGYVRDFDELGIKAGSALSFDEAFGRGMGGATFDCGGVLIEA